jgi:hypothetical protein
MAVTTNRDLVATDDPLAVDLAISMEEQVAPLDRDTTQFTSMLMKLPVETAKSFKEEWEEDQFLPKNTALSATAAAADTELALTTNEGNYAKVGDTGKFVQTGEAFRITGVGASAWTVVRAIGSVSAATAASGTGTAGSSSSPARTSRAGRCRRRSSRRRRPTTTTCRSSATRTASRRPRSG